MNKLARAMADWIEEAMAREIRTLSGTRQEFRAVFLGPSAPILAEVFASLAGDGRLLRAQNAAGSPVDFPVVLQVDDLPPHLPEGTARQSGAVLFHGLARIRNDPNCGVFLTLVPPGAQASDTHESTRKTFGASPELVEGSSLISRWWEDGFVQAWVANGLRGTENEQQAATRLVRSAVVSADSADDHARARNTAWNVLERLWELRDAQVSTDYYVSLATGFPPSDSGLLDDAAKSWIFEELADRLERLNFGGAIEQLKEKARDDTERRHLDQFLSHLRARCDVVTALRRSFPHFYAPGDINNVPEWWRGLSVERWTDLLAVDGGGDDPPPPGEAITISCANPMISHLKGFVPVVEDVATLRVELPESAGSKTLRVSRDAPGGAASRRTWDIPIEGRRIIEVDDDGIPPHKSPIKYIVELVGEEGKSSLRLVALNGWLPGVIVSSRTAAKGSLPKASRTSGVDFETSLSMIGQGRHYVDIFLRPGVDIVDPEAVGSDENGQVDEGVTARISRVADREHGLEVEATAECFYQFHIKRQGVGSNKPELFRIGLLAEQVPPEECSSHFEMLLLRNSKREGGKIPRAVHINNQVRSSQLQAWMLEPENAGKSFYPIVLAKDYSAHWRPRNWSSAAELVYSSGRFLTDPRPPFEDMIPPPDFIAARQAIASRIRGEDGSDLIEGLPLGKLIVEDAEFAATVDTYVKSYLEWLSHSPNEAAWCDLAIVAAFEGDGVTLSQVPDALVVSPLHPLRLAWQCLAQRAMFLAQRKLPCPAASILDPDCIPDAISLPLRTATGGIERETYFSVECNSDYWGILWNSNRLDLLSRGASGPPLDREMGLLVGGISSGFSVSQVHRALDDVCEMLVAKPVVSVLVSSAAGQNNACNEGILSWGRRQFASEAEDRPRNQFLGVEELHVLDDRRPEAFPDDAEISNVAEDTGNALQWYSGSIASDAPDLAIIAQLETSNARALPTKLSTPLGMGGLVRIRIREQLQAASGKLLCESRMAAPSRASGDGLSDNVANAIGLLENLSDARHGYVFAPSVHAITTALSKAEFAAVSSSAVDPACFLGNWLEGAYLWDYELPAYSGRSGDSNGYYLLSRIKELDLGTLRRVLSRFPDCDDLPEGTLSGIIQEVARRGIPTVRGLSAGDSGATGDLGLLVATRLLQDSFREGMDDGGLLLPWVESGLDVELALVIPVDPFQGYMDDLAKAIRRPTLHRPDLVAACIRITPSSVTCRITPIEVKNRIGTAVMPAAARVEALDQAKSLGSLLTGLRATFTDDVEMILWRIAYQNLIASMVGYGFRVYSQQVAATGRSSDWSKLHFRTIDAILSGEMEIEIDARGRLIVIDGSTTSRARDTDGDGFDETIEFSQRDAGLIARGEGRGIVNSVRERLGDWSLFPAARAPDSVRGSVSVAPAADASVDPGAPIEPINGGQEMEPTEPRDDRPTDAEVTVEAPVDVGAEEPQAGLIIRVGETIEGFASAVRTLNLGDTALNQMNMGVVGDLGTGKTQLLKSLVHQIAEGKGNRAVKPKVLIFDYKKDYTNEDFVLAVGAKVIKPHHLPINLFDLREASQSVAPWLERYKFFSDVLDKIYSGIGPVQRDRLKSAIKEAYARAASGEYPTIYDVHRNYVDLLRGSADSLSGILGDIVDMELFCPDARHVVAPDEFLGGVVVISLNELGQDDRTKNMLVAVLLNVFYEHMLRIPKRPFLGVDGKMRVVDSMLLVDEADNIMKYEFEVLRKILLQGREFGVGVILASQYLSHFKQGGTDYREPLLTWFIHKVPNIRAQELGAIGLSDPSALPNMAERIKSLALHECLYKTHEATGEFIRGAPFYRRGEWS